MQLSQIPARIFAAFANAGNKRTIPVASQIGITAGAASYTDGFPPLTFTPLNAGGVPPAGQDFNGILNAITAVQQWQAGGGLFTYDATWSTANGGYPKGALLLKADGSGYWRNLVDNNAVNPDTVGTNWVDISPGGLLATRVFATPGTSVYTPTPGTKAVIVELVGGGGGSGGSSAAGAGQVALSGGGAGASYGMGLYTSSFSGVTITVGARGAAGAAGAAGGAGGTSSFGALLSASGGGNSTGGAPSSLMYVSASAGNSGTVTGANLRASLGTEGGHGLNVTNAFSGAGGNSLMGSGAGGGSNGPGGQCDSPGGGASGAATIAGGGAQAGGAGGPGMVIVREYA